MVKKQVTGKRDESVLHSAARSGNLGLVLEIIGGSEDEGLKDLVGRRNRLGETALYVAAESGFVEVVKAILRSCDVQLAGVKARNGFDAFHIAAKNGQLEVIKALLQVDFELSMTCDKWNTTALHTAASQGHTQVVNFLLENVTSLTAVAMNNEKTCLHLAARNGHLDVMKALLRNEPGMATRVDRKGQTPLHMAAKGHSVDVVFELLHTEPSLVHIVDAKGNTALHIATRKGRTEIVQILMKLMKTQPAANSAKDQLKQAVSDIQHEVHDQLHHTHQTRKRVQGMAKRINKMHTEGLNNAINSTTLVAVLIATIAFAAIFNIPGQFADSSKDMISPSVSPGQARISSQLPFMIFIVFDSIALFISLAVVVVQTSLVVVEKRAKKALMTIISKVMWLACVMISVAFLAIAFIVVGDDERWMAVCVSVLGALILVPTLATLCYWVIMNRVHASQMQQRNIRSRSGSLSIMSLQNVVSDSEIVTADFQNQIYAV